MNVFTNEQLQELLTAQRTLNEKYTGKDWMKVVPLENFLVAVQTEVSEFYESAPENWKWWKSDKNDTQNMIIETIDVVHFGLSALMYVIGDNDRIIDMNTRALLTEYTPSGEAEEILKGQTMFLMYCFEDRAEPALLSFYHMISNMAVACDRDMNEIYNGYFKKNELNRKRVEGGYREGNYQKLDSDGNEDNALLDV